MLYFTHFVGLHIVYHQKLKLMMEGYDDILAPRRQGWDIQFALRKSEELPEYKYLNRQQPKQFKEQVLKSQRLRHTIDQVG